MTTLRLEVEGLDAVMRRLDGMGGVRVLEPAMWRAVYRLQNYMQEYPPQRSGSTYVRTGTLGRRWTVAVHAAGNTLTGKVGNNTVYAPFVQSSRFQARVHRGRWRTDLMAIDANRQQIIRDFIAALRGAMG
jgi:hypothetical protein